MAQRKRYYFTNSIRTCEPPQDAIPWDLPWTSIEQVTGNAKHRLLPIVRLQGQDRVRGLYRHSHIALHPYSLLYHTDTLPSLKLMFYLACGCHAALDALKNAIPCGA